MDSLIPPFWKNPPPDFLGLSGQQSDRAPKHILKVSACFSKCPGQILICLYYKQQEKTAGNCLLTSICWELASRTRIEGHGTARTQHCLEHRLKIGEEVHFRAVQFYEINTAREQDAPYSSLSFCAFDK